MLLKQFENFKTFLEVELKNSKTFFISERVLCFFTDFYAFLEENYFAF